MPSTTALTLSDYEQLPGNGTIYELHEGELVEVTRPKAAHTNLQLEILESLLPFCKEKKIGRIGMEIPFQATYEGKLVLRAPDLSFLTSGRAPNENGYFGPPELAVEVVSHADLAGEIEQKLAVYMAVGVAEIWVMYPQTRTVHVWNRNSGFRLLDENGTLESPDLLPGWRIGVGELFARAAAR